MERLLQLWDEVDELGSIARFWAGGVVGLVADTSREALGRIHSLIRALRPA